MAQQFSAMHLLTIYVPDVFKELDFFNRLLGFEVVVNDMPANYAIIKPSRGPEVWLRIVKHDDLHTFHKHINNLELNVEVENLDQLISAIYSEDVKIERLPAMMPWGWRHAWVRDPANNLLSIYQTDGKPMAVGSSRASAMAFHAPGKTKE